MRRLLLLAALVLLAAPASSSAVTMYACAGMGTDDGYRKAFDGVRGQVLDGNVRYPDRRTLWEHQTWLTPFDQSPGHGSEHLHVKACLPQGETLTTGNGTEYIDVAVGAHNVSGYKAIAVSGSYVTQNGSNAAFIATQAQLDQVTAAMQSSGHLGINWVYLSMPLRAVAANGLKELRWGLTVVRSDSSALVERWTLDARAYWTHAYPGLPGTTPMTDNTRYIRNRTIINFINPAGAMQQSYHHAGLCNKELTADGLWGCDSDEWNWDDYIVDRPDVWTVGNRVTDGGGPATLEIDPNHHVHPDYRGSWFVDWYQFTSGAQAPTQFASHDVPLGALGLTKWHKLFFGSDDQPECVRTGNPCPLGTRPAWRDVVVMPFKANAS